MCELELRDATRVNTGLRADKSQLHEALDTANHVAKVALDVAEGRSASGFVVQRDGQVGSSNISARTSTVVRPTERCTLCKE